MFSLFRKTVTAPTGQVYSLYADMARQHNLLIAGEVGSGKSCAMNSIIYNLLHECPDKVQFIFIDPKFTEFGKYKRLPHTLKYACENDEITDALNMALAIIDRRKRDLQRRELAQYDGGHIYIFIDEMAEIMLTMKKTAKPILQRVCQIGRALNVHVIAGTQCPLATVIPTEIKVNFTGIVGLRTATAQHSRNIINQAGCELFPEPREAGVAYAYYMRGGHMDLWKLPRYSDDQYRTIIQYWQRVA